MSSAKEWFRTSLLKSLPAFLAAFVIMALAAGCTAPLKVSYTAGERTNGFKNGAAPSIFISPLKDARSAGELETPREIGRIEATVFDINSDRLVIADDPALLATGALAEEFAAYGYDVITDPAGADYLLEGELREFRLDIADRDRVAIELAATVKEMATGKVVWSGGAEQRAERYAGVMGNSKASIEKYINASLSLVATSVVEGTSAKVDAKKPEMTPQAAGSVERAPQTTKAAAGSGMSINTVPQRAKVYIGGVYYGLAPLNLELDPGIYELEVRKKGYKTGREKVSVRDGETTEVEMELKGE